MIVYLYVQVILTVRIPILTKGELERINSQRPELPLYILNNYFC